jgi:hypothetical protein
LASFLGWLGGQWRSGEREKRARAGGEGIIDKRAQLRSR